MAEQRNEQQSQGLLQPGEPERHPAGLSASHTVPQDPDTWEPTPMIGLVRSGAPSSGDGRRSGIGPLRPTDADDVAHLWESCGLTRPWNPPQADFLRALGGQASDVLGVRDEGDHVIATVMVGHDGHRGWMYYLAVDDAHRGQGIGHQLVAAAQEWLLARGIPKIMLMVRAANTQVLDFYEEQGFGRSTSVVMERWLERP